MRLPETPTDNRPDNLFPWESLDRVESGLRIDAAVNWTVVAIVAIVFILWAVL
jgi:hypothetical protein